MIELPLRTRNLVNAPLIDRVDDVTEYNIELLSIFSDNGDLCIIAAATAAAIMPHVSLLIDIRNEESKTIAKASNERENTASVTIASRIERLGKEYLGKTLLIDACLAVVDPDGELRRYDLEFNEVITEQPPIESLEVKKPRAADGKKTVIVYGTYMSSYKPDYHFPVNNKSGTTVKAMLPLCGKLVFAEEWEPVEVDLTSENGPKLFMLLSKGGSLAYNKDFNGMFVICDNCVEFIADEDWDARLDIGRLGGSSTTFDIYFSFSVKLKNKFYPTYDYTAKAIVVCKTEQSEYDPLTAVTLIEPVFVYWDCVASDTLVSIYPSGNKPIEQIEKDDLVLTPDGGFAKVTANISAHADELICVFTASGRELVMTPTHMVKTKTGFVPASDLTSCGYLLSEDGKSDDITEVKTTGGGKVYSLSVENDTEWIANGIITGSAGRLLDGGWRDEAVKTRGVMQAFTRSFVN